MDYVLFVMPKPAFHYSISSYLVAWFEVWLHYHFSLQTKGPSWSVPTGWRDGLVSSSSDDATFPTPLDSVSVLKQKFSDKGFIAEDLVGKNFACSLH